MGKIFESVAYTSNTVLSAAVCCWSASHHLLPPYLLGLLDPMCTHDKLWKKWKCNTQHIQIGTCCGKVSTDSCLRYTSSTKKSTHWTLWNGACVCSLSDSGLLASLNPFCAAFSAVVQCLCAPPIKCHDYFTRLEYLGTRRGLVVFSMLGREMVK